jgi:uncharacterized membrane protein
MALDPLTSNMTVSSFYGTFPTNFIANKATNALSIAVAGNFQQVLNILISIPVFHLDISRINAVGVLLTLIGGVMYSKIVRDSKRLRPLNHQ